MTHFILVNGVHASGVPNNDRGLAFGDGVFETMSMVQGSLPLWHYHKQRLLKGLQRLEIGAPADLLAQSFQQLFEHLQAINANDQNGVAKLMVTRGSSSTGYQYPQDIHANVILSFEPKDIPVPTCEHLIRCQTPMYENTLLAGVKHLSRLENVLARKESQQAGYRDGLLCDARGNMIETTNSNLFFVDQDNQLITPLLESCGVAGVMRRLIMEEVAPALGVTVQEKPVPYNHLDNIKAAFKCNALTGVIEIASIATYRFPANNDLIESVRQGVIQFATRPVMHQQEHFLF